MVLICFFIIGTFSWFPSFHQVISTQFSYEFFPYITEVQRNAFILGAIYCDGYDKSRTHDLAWLKPELNKIDHDSELYWFFMGNVAHISADVFAHNANPKAFIVPSGFKHHLSEAIIDSYIAKTYNRRFLTLSKSLKTSLSSVELRYSHSFSFLYPCIYLLTKIPLYRFLPNIQNDQCPKGDFSLSACNFQNHYEAMLECLRITFPKLFDEAFTGSKLVETSANLLRNILCCETNRFNQTLLDNVDLMSMNPSLYHHESF